MIQPYLGPYISSLIFRGVANSLFGEHETAALLKTVYQDNLKKSGAETLGQGEGCFCHTTSVLTCWGNEFF